MINKFLRMLYVAYNDRFLGFMVEDFYKDIPKNISNQALVVARERRDKLEKWLNFQAFFVSRRIGKDKKQVDVLFGMLLQIKMMLTMLGKNDILEKQEGKTNIRAEKSNLKSDLGGVKSFLNKK